VNNKMTKTKIFIVFLIAISLPVYLVSRNVFVTSEYSSTKAPLTGATVSEKIINRQHYIILPEIENYVFDKINLNIIPRGKITTNEVFEIKAFQNFQAAFYPERKEDISEERLIELMSRNNRTEVPNGAMFSDGDVVGFMQPGDLTRTVLSPELFEKMGYKWEDIISQENGFMSSLNSGTIWRYGEPHPSGTFLEVNDKVAMIWDETILSLQKEIEIRNHSSQTPIKIDVNLKEFDDCQTNLTNNTISCDFKKETPNLKSNYLFLLPSSIDWEIEEVKVALSVSPSWSSFKKNFKTSITDIKASLIKTYREYIPFI